MRKYVILCFILSLALGGFYLINKKAEEKAQAKEKIQTMPDFEFLALDSTVFSVADLAGRKTILVYFNSTCEHCQYEASEISKQIDKFSNVNLLFVSEQNLAEIRTFSERYSLDKQENIKFLKAPDNGFYKVFGSNPIPSIFIYNTKKQLVKNYKGETKVELLMMND
ncbi:peroxiredoxin family protein [Thermoflexibacter ruber]|uniref:AhpC/TSA family protein n=1 Tax=Thermoflexibacter ruber TaxID=1003 RepID=A0A1I2IW98_9BACT|nr:TlpA disulfide reductase family protein [Thermoflexibacter ruber]SFF46752.1 AhpC/TSA family protein [Thermoflexibacter ruber]